MNSDDFYVRFYKNFCEFCRTGIKVDVERLRNETKNKKIDSEERDFRRDLCDIFSCVVGGKKFYNISKAVEDGYLQNNPDKWVLYSRQWVCYSILCVAYSYISHDQDSSKRYEEKKLSALKNYETQRRLDLEKLEEDYNTKISLVSANPEELEKLKKDYKKKKKNVLERPDLSQDYNLDVHKIERHISKSEIMNNAYTEHFSDRDFRLQNDNFMMILKGFSSSSPFFYPALRERFHHIPIRGGGFFVKWRGYGIVIDPGINFMENMHRNNLYIRDINAVIVTHNHIDHNGDLFTIDDFASQFDKNDIELYCDYDTAKECENRIKKFRKPPFTINSKTPSMNINGQICLYVEQTQHMIDKKEGNNIYYKENNSFAIKLILKDDNGTTVTSIGYTSDTCYMNVLPAFFGDCDYIIANISETNDNDYKRQNYKDTHLGYYGCYTLIEKIKSSQMKKTVFILSEFWAGKGDVRKELVKRLRIDTGYDSIYLGDIGMMFFLNKGDKAFRCSHCCCAKPLEELRIIRTGGEYSPFITVCSDCIL